MKRPAADYAAPLTLIVASLCGLLFIGGYFELTVVSFSPRTSMTWLLAGALSLPLWVMLGKGIQLLEGLRDCDRDR